MRKAIDSRSRLLRKLVAEKSNPVGDIGYFGVTFGMKLVSR